MAGLRWPPDDSDLPQPRALAPADLFSDDDRSVAADSWSIKSEYGSTLDDDQRHVDTSEVLSSGNFPAASDYSSDKDEPDVNEDEPSMLGLQSYWNASYAEDLANFHEHGHVGEVWFGAEVVDTVVAWTKNLCLNMSQDWIAVNDGNGKYASDDISNRLSSWSVLDIGTGNGLLLQELAKIGFSDLTGTDYSEGAIDLSRNLAARNGFPQIKFLVDDVLETKLDKKFQLVMDKGTFDAIGLHPDGPVKRCPACRNYKPHYEKVARLFNGPNAVHPGIVLMARVDCAMKVNTDLCDKFSVGRYPMLLWGPPHKFTSSGWDPKQEKSEIKSIDDARTAERLLNWINKRIGSSFSLDDKKYDNENTLPWNATDPEQIARAIYDIEEATSQSFEIITDSKRIMKETRAPLIKFFQLLIAHHPSKRCRKGTAEILINFDELWPLDLSNSSQDASISYTRDVTKSFPICGKEAPRGYWIFCRGSRNDTRGYSCGLWILLHSLSVRIEDGEAQLTFTVICDFVHNFFICEDCRIHFYEMCSSASVPFNTTRALVLWLWRAHNAVNERLMREEKELGTEDPRYPKMIWPPKDLCPSCVVSSSSKSWNEDEVYKFIMNYYGSSLVSSYKDESITNRRKEESVDDASITTTHAVAVPVGAALAIAVASCAFGALACFWRTQQKNRKWKSSN